MPPRKREGNDADSFTAQAASTPAKRQRVSLACDSCRTAREKCDGARPHCGTCTAQNRPCSYTPASRKRGVQTGYLRSIELSLAWLFEQVPGCEGALHRLLTQNDGADGTRILATKDKAGHRLYRRWSKSRVHKDIGRLLSDEKTPRTDDSAGDSETEEGISPTNAFLFDPKNSPDFSLQGTGPSLDNASASPYTMRHLTTSAESTRLVLPPNWERLIDIYFAYTHCWFPIIDRDAVTTTAMRYPPEGLNLDPKLSTAFHAQLWAVLAVASFQDAASSRTSNANTISPNYTYDIARQLTPPDDGNFETPHICSILLQSLVLLGKSKHMPAWLLIGKASRLALTNRATGTHMYPVRQGSQVSLNDPEKRILAAAFMLDTLASLCLGQPEVTTGVRSSLPSDTFAGLVDPDELWTPIFGVGPTGATTAPSRTPAQPLSTFRQLYAFSKLWAASMDARLHDSPTQKRITPEDLVKSLDPRFSFCNSLIFGGSTPSVPSAFLLQGMFLTVTLDLVPGHRPSLFSNLLEVVESCLENFGPSGTPPLMISLMEIVRQHGHSERMHEHDKTRWKAVMETLQGVWNPNSSRIEGPESLRHQSMTAGVENPSQPIPGPPYVEEISTATYHTTHRPSSTIGEAETRELTRLQQQKDQQSLLSYEQHRHPTNSEPSPGTSQSLYAVTPNMTFQSPPLSGGHAIPIFQNAGIDYDAILEELGSIDCADSIDVDPQFMTNLGFAPGCDLGMFQGDFGT
ncbi:hypothetical protein B0T10DRAFT_479246 [Thelonectria olida]|uniref:Zn(2)-C6 fungal-type domain-containing protein n=1 Tax=Thelonectria olida TaxID=1576542 RepID=A0A9P8WF92_9HYPO|nr:hypothetical protein B0T10DRAFT_479246 [Thelonectria olida]